MEDLNYNKIRWGLLESTEGDDQEFMRQDHFLKRHELGPTWGVRVSIK